MAGYADLEIGLHRGGTGGYSAELRFSQLGNNADVRLTSGAPALARELTGDTQGAIEDFCFFVDHSTNDAAIGQCQA